jgi:hypothetical protein
MKKYELQRVDAREEIFNSRMIDGCGRQLWVKNWRLLLPAAWRVEGQVSFTGDSCSLLLAYYPPTPRNKQHLGHPPPS